MAIYVDACLCGAEWRFRLWDTQTETYATDECGDADMTLAIKWHFANGGTHVTPDANAIIAGWLAKARERGTNDPSKKTVVAAERSWRTTDSLEPAGPLRAAFRSRTLSEQAAKAIFELRVAEWTARLSPAAVAFLDRSFVLAELLRGKGLARHRVTYPPSSHDLAVVNEIEREWADVVTVEQIDSLSHGQTCFTFRLR